MKNISVYIAKHKLDGLLLDLCKYKTSSGETLSGLTIFRTCEGFGRGRGVGDETGNSGFVLLDRAKLELVCADSDVEGLVAHIEHVCSTSSTGDGKIFISPVEEAVRISNHERGEKAA